MQALDNVKSIL